MTKPRMKRTRPKRPIKKVSDKQVRELKKRQLLKAELIAEFGEYCMKCGSLPDWRGLQLVHLLSLSRGGKTDKTNCQIWCAPCHFGPNGHRLEL